MQNVGCYAIETLLKNKCQMKWNEIFQQIIVSGLVSGILIFIFQQWILLRFKKTDKRFDSQLKYQQNSYESTIQGFKIISDQLLNLEDYIRNKINDDINKGIFEPNKWDMIFETQNIIRKNSIAIPEDLYQKSLGLLEIFSKDINKVGDYMREIQIRGQIENISISEYKDNLEERMNIAYRNFRQNVDKLRTEFRTISQDIYFDKKGN